MISPLSIFVAVFAVGFVLQIVFSRHRIAMAVVMTATPLAIMMLTVWWRIWERDALWIVGFVMAFLDCAAASIASGLVAWGIHRYRQSGRPNDR